MRKIPYNFSKFFVTEEGKVTYFNAFIDPLFLVPEIESYLNKK